MVVDMVLVLIVVEMIDRSVQESFRLVRLATSLEAYHTHPEFQPEIERGGREFPPLPVGATLAAGSAALFRNMEQQAGTGQPRFSLLKLADIERRHLESLCLDALSGSWK